LLSARLKTLVYGHPYYRKFTGDNAWNPTMHDLVVGLFINRYEFGRPI